MSGFVINKQTGATQFEFKITSYEKGVTFQADGVLSGAEEITLEQPDGAGWATVTIGGNDQKISVADNVLTFYGTGIYRINKTPTVAPVGVRVTYHG